MRFPALIFVVSQLQSDKQVTIFFRLAHRIMPLNNLKLHRMRNLKRRHKMIMKVYFKESDSAASDSVVTCTCFTVLKKLYYSTGVGRTCPKRSACRESGFLRRPTKFQRVSSAPPGRWQGSLCDTGLKTELHGLYSIYIQSLTSVGCKAPPNPLGA